MAPVSFLPGGTIALGGRECPGRGGPAGSDQEELTQVDLSRAGAGASRALGEGSRTGDPRWGTGERMASGDRGKTSKSPPDCPGSGDPALHGLSPASKGPREGLRLSKWGGGMGSVPGLWAGICLRSPGASVPLPWVPGAGLCHSPASHRPPWASAGGGRRWAYRLYLVITAVFIGLDRDKNKARRSR